MNPWNKIPENAYLNFQLRDVEDFIEKKKQEKFLKAKQVKEEREKRRQSFHGYKYSSDQLITPEFEEPKKTSVSYPSEDLLMNILKRAEDRKERRKKIKELQNIKQFEKEQKKIEEEKLKAEKERVKQRERIKRIKEEEKIRLEKEEKRRKWESKLENLNKVASDHYNNYLLKKYFRKFINNLIESKRKTAQAEVHYEITLIRKTFYKLYLNKNEGQQKKIQKADKFYNYNIMKKYFNVFKIVSYNKSL